MDICAVTRMGKAKAANEDRLLVNKNIVADGCLFINDYSTSENTDTPVLLAVSDGVGGNNAGEVASSFIINRLSNLQDDDPTFIELYIKNINGELIDKSNTEAGLYKMAATLSGLFIKNNCATMFHIGNTRIYTSTSKYLKQITEDHTVVYQLLKTGRLTQKEAEAFDRRNEITACLGANDRSLIDRLYVNVIIDFDKTAKILMTSDGVHEYVSLDELEELLDTEINIVEKCMMIIDKALQNGSTDDISVILALR